MQKFLLTLSLLIITIAGTAQAKAEKKIAEAVSALHQAMINKDKTALEGLVADKLSYGHSGNLVENKAEFIDKIVTGKSDWITMTISDQIISISGKTAIVRHVLTGKTNDSGKTGDVHLRVMHVWQKTKSGWKLLGRQAVKIT